MKSSRHPERRPAQRAEVEGHEDFYNPPRASYYPHASHHASPTHNHAVFCSA